MSDSDDGLDRRVRRTGRSGSPALVARLSRGPATVNELAEPFPITLQAISRHVQVLAAAGLITRSRNGQQRPCHLDAAALDDSPAGSTPTGSKPSGATAGSTPSSTR